MDERGQIHHIADESERARLEALHGALVPIPEEELDAVKALSVPDRQAWFRARLGAEQKRERKAARKRQRDARKASRRAR